LCHWIAVTISVLIIEYKYTLEYDDDEWRISTPCPVLFGILDNGLSISYNTKHSVETLFGHDPLAPLFVAQGHDMYHVYHQTQQVVDYARTHREPKPLK
jgi:hypothetical protein